MTKKILMATAAFALIAGLGALTTAKAAALGGFGGPGDLKQKLIERFNLNADEVDQFFEEQRQERQEEMHSRFEERLNQAVEDGKLTEDQKNALLQKMEENQAERETWQDLTPEERQAKMEEHREEMQAWMEENGIDPLWLGPGMGMGRPPGGEPRGNGGPRERPAE